MWKQLSDRSVGPKGKQNKQARKWIWRKKSGKKNIGRGKKEMNWQEKKKSGKRMEVEGDEIL